MMPRKKAYALIYVLLFIVLLLTTVVTTWVTGMFDISLQRRTEAATQGYLLAKMGIDDGWIRYKNDIGTSDIIPTIRYPSVNACLATNPVVHRITFNSSGSTTPSDVNLQTSVNLAPYGVYDYRVCSNGSPNQFEAIGYFKGNKITLKAIVTHVDTTSTDPITGIITRNHDGDYLTIYQTGPSG